MKAIVIATVTFIISLFGSRLSAAETAVTAPPSVSVEQLFQQADVQLAIEQYKKLRMAEFDLKLKLQTEAIQSDEQRRKLETICAELRLRAEDLRTETLKTASVVLAISK
jgi:hypothetical protein